jgi:hypothetical protein
MNATSIKQKNNDDSNDQTYTRWRAAVHEASHAICHAANGVIRVKHVHVFLENGCWVGFTSTELQPAVNHYSTIKNDLAVGSGHLAGHVGEGLHANPVPELHNIDEIIASIFISITLSKKSYNGNLDDYTRKILRRNKAPLLALANALLIKSKVEGIELSEMLSGVR